SIIAAFAMVGLASAHSRVTHFHINGTPNSDCVRQATSTNPITDLNSSDMACNAVQSNGKTKCVVKGGDSIAFEWRSDPGIPAAEFPLKGGTIPVGVTDDSHKGPCTIYMKKVDDALTASGPGDGWFKVTEDGLDSAGTFCTDRLRLANAPQPGVVPKNIAPGDYLFRSEIVTLNNAGPANMGGQEEPQFYVSCVQVTVEGTSGDPDVEKISIPGYFTKSSPGLVFDIWNSETFSNYPIPGPKALTGDAGSSPAPAAPSSPAPAKPTAA
ncbi:Lytic polysaccharide monooxygenase, partial [Tuber magnatum]